MDQGKMDQLARSTVQRIETRRSKSLLSNSNRAPGLTAELHLPQHSRLFIAYICTNLIMTFLFRCSGANGYSQYENITIVQGNDPRWGFHDLLYPSGRLVVRRSTPAVAVPLLLAAGSSRPQVSHSQRGLVGQWLGCVLTPAPNS